MSEGEQLLQNHKKNVRLFTAMKKRIEQYRLSINNSDAVIENLALRHAPILEVVGGRPHESPTERVVEKYRGVHEQEQRVLQTKISHLETKLHALQDLINLYDAVLSGLEQPDVWLIQEYFIKGKTLDELAAERDCAKSTMLSKKRKVIQRVDALLIELCSDTDMEVFSEASF